MRTRTPGASDVLILDAVDYGLEPGTLKLVTGDDVPVYGLDLDGRHSTGTGST